MISRAGGMFGSGPMSGTLEWPQGSEMPNILGKLIPHAHPIEILVDRATIPEIAEKKVIVRGFGDVPGSVPKSSHKPQIPMEQMLKTIRRFKSNSEAHKDKSDKEIALLFKWDWPEEDEVAAEAVKEEEVSKVAESSKTPNPTSKKSSAPVGQMSFRSLLAPRKTIHTYSQTSGGLQAPKAPAAKARRASSGQLRKTEKVWISGYLHVHSSTKTCALYSPLLNRKVEVQPGLIHAMTMNPMETVLGRADPGNKSMHNILPRDGQGCFGPVRILKVGGIREEMSEPMWWEVGFFWRGSKGSEGKGAPQCIFPNGDPQRLMPKIENSMPFDKNNWLIDRRSCQKFSWDDARRLVHTMEQIRKRAEKACLGI